MKYCSKCGNEIVDEAIICTKCGCQVGDFHQQEYASPIKYCSKCGSELNGDAIVCLHCGCLTDDYHRATIQNTSNINGLKTATKVLMIIATVFSGFFYLIPLAWTIPMTVIYCNKIKNGEPVGVGFKVCSLIFVSLIAGILMLCDNNKD